MSPLRALVLLLAVSPLVARAETPDDPEEPPGWDGTSISVGLVALGGNSRTLTVSADALADHETEHWELHGTLGVIYGWSAAADDDEEDADAAWFHGLLRGERRFGATLTAFLLVGGEVNHPASLEGRAEAEGGVGLTLIDRRDEDEERLFLRLYLGAHVSNDYRFQFAPVRTGLEDVFMLGPGAGLRLRWRPTARIELGAELRLRPNLWGPMRVLSYADSRLTVELTERLALEVHLLLEHDTRPAPDRERLDLALTTGLMLQF